MKGKRYERHIYLVEMGFGKGHFIQNRLEVEKAYDKCAGGIGKI